MPRLTLALGATGCYLLGWLLGFPAATALSATVAILLGSENYGHPVIMVWIAGCIYSLPFFLVLLVKMLVFRNHLLAHLKRWCLLIPIVVTLALPSTICLALMVGRGELLTMNGLKLFGGIWAYGALLTLSNAATSSALFYFWMRRLGPTWLKAS